MLSKIHSTNGPLVPVLTNERGGVADAAVMPQVELPTCKTLLRIAFYSWKRTTAAHDHCIITTEVESNREVSNLKREQEKADNKDMWRFKAQASKPEGLIDEKICPGSSSHGTGWVKLNAKKRTCNKGGPPPWKPGGRQPTKAANYTQKLDARTQDAEFSLKNESVKPIANGDATAAENSPSTENAKGSLSSYSSSEAGDIPDLASVREFEKAVMATMGTNSSHMGLMSSDLRTELLRCLAALSDIVQGVHNWGCNKYNMYTIRELVGLPVFSSHIP